MGEDDKCRRAKDGRPKRLPNSPIDVLRSRYSTFAQQALKKYPKMTRKREESGESTSWSYAGGDDSD
eukprot:scaffold3033_cov250-Chaetoceros_neogracile.AAC.1